MKYRVLDANGDYSFGGSREFLANSPYTAGQAVMTRLRLLTGEWFLNQAEGTPYNTEILGAGTTPTYDLAISERILGTQGVVSILKYSSSRDPATRALTVTATIDTIYSQDQNSTTTIQVAL